MQEKVNVTEIVATDIDEAIVKASKKYIELNMDTFMKLGTEVYDINTEEEIKVFLQGVMCGVTLLLGDMKNGRARFNFTEKDI